MSNTTATTLIALANIGYYDCDQLTVTLQPGDDCKMGNVKVMFTGTHQHICEKLEANFCVPASATGIPHKTAIDINDWLLKRISDYMPDAQAESIGNLVLAMGSHRHSK